eukprot:jgi/Mesen1/4391/ME000223S03465
MFPSSGENTRRGNDRVAQAAKKGAMAGVPSQSKVQARLHSQKREASSRKNGRRDQPSIAIGHKNNKLSGGQKKTRVQPVRASRKSSGTGQESVQVVKKSLKPVELVDEEKAGQAVEQAGENTPRAVARMQEVVKRTPVDAGQELSRADEIADQAAATTTYKRRLRQVYSPRAYVNSRSVRSISPKTRKDSTPGRRKSLPGPSKRLLVEVEDPEAVVPFAKRLRISEASHRQQERVAKSNSKGSKPVSLGLSVDSAGVQRRRNNQSGASQASSLSVGAVSTIGSSEGPSSSGKHLTPIEFVLRQSAHFDEVDAFELEEEEEEAGVGTALTAGGGLLGMDLEDSHEEEEMEMQEGEGMHDRHEKGKAREWEEEGRDQGQAGPSGEHVGEASGSGRGEVEEQGREGEGGEEMVGGEGKKGGKECGEAEESEEGDREGEGRETQGDEEDQGGNGGAECEVLAESAEEGKENREEAQEGDQEEEREQAVVGLEAGEEEEEAGGQEEEEDEEEREEGGAGVEEDGEVEEAKCSTGGVSSGWGKDEDSPQQGWEDIFLSRQ